MNKNPIAILLLNDEVCDARDDDSSTGAGYKIVFTLRKELPKPGPNPFSNSINVFSSVPVKRISVWTVEGKQVFSTSSIGGSQVPVNNKLPAGMYIVRIETTEGVVQRKLMKRD